MRLQRYAVGRAIAVRPEETGALASHCDLIDVETFVVRVPLYPDAVRDQGVVQPSIAIVRLAREQALGI